MVLFLLKTLPSLLENRHTSSSLHKLNNPAPDPSVGLALICISVIKKKKLSFFYQSFLVSVDVSLHIHKCFME